MRVCARSAEAARCWPPRAFTRAEGTGCSRHVKFEFRCEVAAHAHFTKQLEAMMDSSRRDRRSRLPHTSFDRPVVSERWRRVIESLEQRLLLRTPIPDLPHPGPAKPGPNDHAPVYQPQAPLTGQQRWPIQFDSSNVRELAPDTIDPKTGISPPNRVLDPADIVWVNRGLASDNFTAIFGTFAGQARAVVDAVIVRYEQMIGSFDYPLAGQTYSLTLSMAAANSGFGASANLLTSQGGKPKSGSISMGSGSGTGTNTDHGWFLDPTPFENSEFEGNITNAFAGDAQGSSPAFNKGDFFTVVAAEMTHCMGLFNTLAGWTNLTTDTGMADTVTGVGNYYTFVGPSISHLGTSDNAGSSDFHEFIHSAEGASSINFNGQFWRGAEDQGNAFYEFSRRYLVNNTFALMFHDAYGYASVNPAQFGTMYTILQNDGTLLVRGSSATSNDLIVIDASGGNLVISVDVGTDVGGTGPFAGDQNLPAFVTLVPAASVSSISVQAGLGNDIVRIENNAGKPTNVDGGPGDDFTDFSFNNRFWDSIQGFSNVFGGTGTDSIFMYDNNNSNPDTYTIDLAQVNRPFFGGMFYGADVENLTVWAGSPVNTVNIPSTYFATNTFLNNSGGNDVVNVGQPSNGVQSVGGYLQIQNDPAFSVITVNDTGDTLPRTPTQDTVTLSGSPFGRISGLAPAVIDYQYLDTNDITVVTGNAVDDFDILATGKPFKLSNQGGADFANVGNGLNGVQSILSPVTIINPPSFTTLTVNDTADAVGRTATLDTFNPGDGIYGRITSLAPAQISYKVGDINNPITINAGSGGDTFNVLTTPDNRAFTLNTNNGVDPVNITNVGASSTFNVNTGDGSDNVTLRALPADAIFNFNGGPLDDTLTLIGAAGGLDPLDGTMNVDGGGGTTDRMFLEDQGFAGFSINTITNSSFVGSHNGTLNYANLELVQFDMSSTGGGFTNVESSAAGTAVIVNGGGGNDAVALSNSASNVSNILGPVTVNGNGNTSDTLTVNDQNNAVGQTFTVTGTGVTRPGFGGVSYGTIEFLTLSAQNVASTINVLGTSVSTTISANGGDDVVRLGAGNLNLLSGPITVNGGAGTADSVILDDSALAAADTYTLTSTQVTRPGGFGGLAYATIESLRLLAETGNNIINVNSTASTTPMSINGDPGTDTINLVETDPAAPVTVENSIGDDTVNVNTDGVGAATALFNSTMNLGSLVIRAGGLGNMLPDGNRVLVTKALSISGANGKLDMNDNDMIFDYSGATPIAAVQALINAARNNGNWLGTTGITSTAAKNNAQHNTSLGLIEATDFKIVYGAAAPFDGQTIDTTALLMKYTYYGDTDFNGKVNFDDYVRTDAGFNNHRTGWFNGDFDGNGTINFDDYVLIDLAFNTQGAVL
jgi:hypothetical protein